MHILKKFIFIFLTFGFLSLSSMEEKNTSQETQPQDEANAEYNLFLHKLPLYNLRAIGLINVLQLINTARVNESTLNLPEELKVELELFKKIDAYFYDLEKKSDGRRAELVIQLKNKVYKLASLNAEYAELFLKIVDELVNNYCYYDEDFMVICMNNDFGIFNDMPFANSYYEPFRIMNLLIEILMSPENSKAIIQKYHKFYLKQDFAGNEYALMEYFAQQAVKSFLWDFLKLIVTLNLLPRRMILDLLEVNSTHSIELVEVMAENITKEELEYVLNKRSSDIYLHSILTNDNHDYYEIAKFIFELMEKLGIDVTFYINRLNKTPNSLLYHAFLFAKEDMVNFLLEKGAIIYTSNDRSKDLFWRMKIQISHDYERAKTDPCAAPNLAKQIKIYKLLKKIQENGN